MVSPDMPLMLNSVDAAPYSYANNYAADRVGLNPVVGLQNQGSVPTYARTSVKHDSSSKRMKLSSTSPDELNGTEDSAQTDNNSHFNNSRPGSSGTNPSTAPAKKSVRNFRLNKIYRASQCSYNRQSNF